MELWICQQMITLDKVKYADSDEFYTKPCLVHSCVKALIEGGYSFKGKTVFCPCDSDKSAFPNFLWNNQEKLGLKAVHCACRLPDGSGCFWEGRGRKKMLDSYSFVSDETMARYSDYDLVMTNPPFSYLYQDLPRIVDSCKDFLFIAPEILVVNLAFVLSPRTLYCDNCKAKEKFFVRPGGFERDIGVCKISTLRFANKFRGKPLKQCKGRIHKGVFVCKSRNDVPGDYNGLIATSFAAPQVLDFDYFKMVGAAKPVMKSVVCRRQDYDRLVSEGILVPGKRLVVTL